MKKVAIVQEKNRYSDNELQKFKGIILRKITKAEEDLLNLNDAIKNHHGTDDTARSFEVNEKASEAALTEENRILADRTIRFISDLKSALPRIENKTYGICKITGKLISKERLKAVPHATTSIEAKLNQPQKMNGKYHTVVKSSGRSFS